MSSSWIEQASPAVKQDVASLLNVALDVTCGTLAGGAASRQFAILMSPEGALNVQPAYGADAVSTLVEQVIIAHSSLRAVLVVQDCGDAASPTLRAFGDHRDGPAFDCTITWRQRHDSPLLAIVASQISRSGWWLFE